MAAIVRACINGEIPAVVVVVIGSSESSAAQETAIGLGVEFCVCAEANLALEIERIGPDLICLAGYNRLLPESLVLAYARRILNIHPALLPKFGGKGMYGMRVHQAVLEQGETESGCTVHYVTEQYDEGEITLQMKCPVEPDDTAETLAVRVLALEHIAYPRAIKQVLGG